MNTVYFIRRADGIGPVKIGCTKWPPERLYFMQMWSPYKLEVIATCPGDFADERSVHRAFAAYRMEGEWFAAVPILMELVSLLCTTNELPVELRAVRTPKGKPIRPNRYRDEIVRRVKAGETYQRIGKDLGLTRQRVHQIAAKAGCSKSALRAA